MNLWQGFALIDMMIMKGGPMRFIKHLFLIITLLMTLFVGTIFGKGYERYQSINHEDHMILVIDAIRSEDSYVPLEAMPETLLDATIAIEDHRFYDHGGFDWISTGRAFYSNMLTGEIVSGGSTITQQLAKNLYLTFEQTYERKVAELLLAWTLEDMLSKAEILELYLNVINYGEGQYGIGMASLHYFDKAPGDLSDAECILLSGLPQSPAYYSLNNYEENAIRRSFQVVAAMIENKFLDETMGPIIRNDIREVRQ